MQVVTAVIAKDLAVDSSNLYWTNSASEVWQADTASFTGTKIASGQNVPTRIAVNATNVFWINAGSASIATVAIGGGAVETVTTGAAQEIAVDSSYVYWTDGSSIYKVSATADAGASSTLVPTAPCYALGVTSSTVFCLSYAGGIVGYDKTSGIQTLSEDTKPKSGFWVDGVGACGIREFPVNNYGDYGFCNSGVSGNLGTLPTNVVGDSCGAYWNLGSSTIWKIQNDPLAVPLAIATTASTAGRMVQDDTYLYWIDTNWIGRIHK